MKHGRYVVFFLWYWLIGVNYSVRKQEQYVAGISFLLIEESKCG